MTTALMLAVLLFDLPAGPAAYDPAGRRDPFVPSGRSERPATCPGSGLGARQVAELALRGVVKTPGGMAALLQDPQGRSFVAREGDALCDGRVEAVRPGSIRFRLAAPTDPASPGIFREIRLHPEQ